MQESNSFSFMKEDKTTITVRKAVQCDKQVSKKKCHKSYRPNKNQVEELLSELTAEKLKESFPGKTVVLIKPCLRIDSQELRGEMIDKVWHNIHIQNGKGGDQSSYSVVKIQKGAEHCYQHNKKEKLLQYLKDALWQSYDSGNKYLIKVEHS